MFWCVDADWFTCSYKKQTLKLTRHSIVNTHVTGTVLLQKQAQCSFSSLFSLLSQCSHCCVMLKAKNLSNRNGMNGMNENPFYDYWTIVLSNLNFWSEWTCRFFIYTMRIVDIDFELMMHLDCVDHRSIIQSSSEASFYVWAIFIAYNTLWVQCWCVLYKVT